MPEINQEHVNQLIEGIKNVDFDDGGKVADFTSEMVNVGITSPELVYSLLSHYHFAVRAIAAASLGRIDAPDAVTRLFPLTRDHNHRVRARSLDALSEIFTDKTPPEELFAAIDRGIEDKEDIVRAAAARALGRIEVPDRFDRLSALIKDTSWEVKRAAGRGLGRTGRIEAIPLALSLLDVDNDNLDWNCGDSIDVLAPKFPVEEIRALLEKMPIKNRKTALSTLAQYPTRNGPNLIRGLLAAIEREEVDLIKLGQYGTILPEEPQDEGPRPETFFRQDEIDACLDRLRRPGNRSLVLLGPSGSGKTAIVQEIARKFSENRPGRHPTYILRTSTSELMTGTKYIGEWETKLGGLLGEIRRPKPVILYLTNINEILGAGTSSTSEAGFFSFMAPLIESGEIVVIGESTPEAYQRGLSAHPVARRLFRPVKVEALNRARTRDLLREISRQYDTFFWEKDQRHVVVGDVVLDRLTDLAEGFFQGTALPGKAVDLLREVISAKQADPGPLVLEGTDIISALTRITGLPAHLLDDRMALDLHKVRGFFHDRILGQEEAVETMVDLITLIKSGLNDPDKPLGIFFFVGPTGVGKTEIAKALAEYIFGSPDRMIRVDMSEYKDYHSFEKLIGTPAAGRSSHGGYLTARVQENPFSVILLDEFEKAHPNIFDLFLQVFDDGRLTDAHGTTVNFRNTIVIMTSNLASEWGSPGKVGFIDNLEGFSRGKVLTQMERFFKPEFINRIGRTVVFRPLGPETMRKIAERELYRSLGRWGLVRRKMVADVDQSLINLLVREGINTRFGARPLKRKLEEIILLPVARELLRVTAEDEGAIMRLYARENRTQVRIISTRQTWATPVWNGDDSNGRATVDPRTELESYRARLKALVDQFEQEAMSERRRTQQQRSQAGNFFDEPTMAREVLQEVRWIEHLETGLKGLEDRLLNLREQAQPATPGKKGVDKNLQARLRERLDVFGRDMRMLEFQWRCRDAASRAGTYLVLSSLEGSRLEDEDSVLRLATLYKRWGEGKHLDVKILHEKMGDRDQIKEVVLQIEGAGVAGLLAGEAGIHAFEMDTGEAARRGYVKVEVVPAVPDSKWKPERGDIFMRSHPLPEKEGKLIRRYRSHLEAIHLPTMIDTEILSGVPQEETARIASELLAALVRIHNNLEKGHDLSFDPEAPGTLVRTYVMSPSNPYVHDGLTGLDTRDLEGVLEGGIDNFVRSRIETAPASGPQSQTPVV